MRYILITPAHNEERFISKTLESMVAQTMRPVRWVIVDDGSTDRTAEIVGNYVRCYPWMELIQRQHRQDRNFAGKVHAFNAGWERAQELEFDVIGNLDGDLSFPADYLEFLIQKFAGDSKLGVAGTPFTEDGGYDTAKDSFEGENYVAGGCQLFRRACFEEIGGYVPNAAGGLDWIAVTMARMKGWKVRSFPEKRFHHYRTLGTAQRNQLSALFSYGERAYYLGWSPIWQFFRCIYRVPRKPIFFGAIALLSGYVWASVKRIERPVSPEVVRFHRREQMARLRAILGRAMRFKKIDNFRLEPATVSPPSSDI